MVTIDRPGLASFITLRLPATASGAYRRTGSILVVLGWLQISLLSLTILMWGVMLLSSFVIGAVIGIAQGVGPIPFMGMEIFFLLFILGMGFLFLYWNSWIYAKWVACDPRAPKHALGFGILTILGILTLVLRDSLSMLIVLAKVALGIALLASSHGSKSSMQHPLVDL